MKKLNKENLFPLLFTITNLFILLTSVFFLMNHVKYLLNSDVSINLTEIATQNKDVITSKLSIEMNNLKLGTSQIVDYISKEESINKESINDEILKKIYSGFLTSKQNPQLFVADQNGSALFTDGKEIDVSGRSYYRLAMGGNQNISDRLVSRLDGQDVFIISVPIEYKGKIIGTLQNMYTTQEMYNICALSLFSSQGDMYIINNQGYILITSQQDGYSLESDNYYRRIYTDNPTASKKLQEDIKNEKAGFLETIVNGEKIFSAYTPIDDVYDWYLISSISSNAVSPNTNIVIKMFYVILGIMVILFSLLIAFIWINKQKHQAKLEKIAFEDAVTTGKTHNKFVLELKEALDKHSDGELSILMLDIDNFKYINNFYGFEVGDHVLKAMNEKLEQNLLESEFIARIYNDHFALLLVNIEEQRLINLLDCASELEGIKIYLNAGIYTIMNPKENIRIMLDKASLAAQSIKNIRYQRLGFYSDKFDEQMIRNEQLKRSIEEALKNSEFIPFFQPKIDINTRQLYGAEALARWKTSDGKLISPCDFIPVCENTGVIVFVDMIIFEKTLRFLKQNLDNGIKCVPISVNFSKLHLNNNNFVKHLIDKIEEYHVPANLLEIELTETTMFENYEIISRFIHELHKYDLSISMDDFGSGYSSLSMLKNIEIDVLKIDGSFLRGSTQSNKQKIIFETISKMAIELGMKVVVEGVETIEHVELMQNCNCNIAQGYYYSRPVSEELFGEIFIGGTV